jgi:integrase
MVQLQRLTGARAGEICNIRPGDINRTGDVWEYAPESHKTEHHHRPRVIFIGAKGQRILLPYLLRAADAYCFSPREAESKRRARQHEARKVPLSCGNRPGTNRKKQPRRTPAEKYNRNSYARAVRRAAVKAGVGTWSPHRLRHSFATEVRKSFGLEAVQCCLGHAHASVSEIYAQRDFSTAAEVARRLG